MDGSNTTIPSTATAVAINLTTTDASGNGYLAAYSDTDHAPQYGDTTLTYNASTNASLGADVPIGTGGKITIYSYGAATAVIADIQGYYTTDQTGQVYHTVAPTRLVDSRDGVGGGTSATPGGGSYVILQSVTNQITDLDTATLALNITATQGGPTSGYLVAYPTGATKPATSNIDYNPNQTVANLALVPTGTSSQITIYNQNAATSTVRLIVDCAGYFAEN